MDFQGWEPPQDLPQHFVTRAKTVSVHNGLSDRHFSGLQSSTVSDKRAFMESIWECAVNEHSFPDTCYDPEKPVWRLEVRLHHRIVNEIWQGTQGIKPIYTFMDAVPHLTGLWQYALTGNRYEAKREWVHPIWTKLRDDIGFGYSAPDLLYKRAKKEPGCGNEKNVSLAFGNLLSIYARNRFNSRQAWDCLKKSGFWEDLCSYLPATGDL